MGKVIAYRKSEGRSRKKRPTAINLGGVLGPLWKKTFC